MSKKDRETLPREYRPFKIRAMPDGKYFDDEEFTHGDEDNRPCLPDFNTLYK